jgi:hypothetical protein
VGAFGKLAGASALVAGLAFAGEASAAIDLGYAGAGTPNAAVYQFLSTGAGPITATFVGQEASDDESVGLYIDGVSTGVTGLLNHGASQGDTVVLGVATAAGQVLTFVLYDPPSSYPTVSWWSDPSMNSDLRQHIYSRPVAGGDAFAGSPAGTFVSWEDIGPGSDWDYNDDAFIFTGVTPRTVTSGVPEASTWAMLLAGFGGLGLATFHRGRKARAAAAA